MAKLLIVVVAIVAILGCVSAQGKRGSRPGTCPKLRPIKNCPVIRDKCSRDDQCPVDQKCCFNGCALYCLNIGGNVGPNITPPNRPSNPRCPPLPVTDRPLGCPKATLILDQCNVDSDCTGNNKICCSNGCTRKCITVGAGETPKTRPKPGNCPIPKHPTQGAFACGPQCFNDSECPGNQKCCTNDCKGTNCIAPVRRH